MQTDQNNGDKQATLNLIFVRLALFCQMGPDAPARTGEVIMQTSDKKITQDGF